MPHSFFKNPPEGRYGVRQLAAALACLSDISGLFEGGKLFLRHWDALISARFAINWQSKAAASCRTPRRLRLFNHLPDRFPGRKAIS
jgi:hypothetical protein